MSDQLKKTWNERYSKDNFYYGDSPNTFLKENINLFKDRSSILCIGDGEGRNSVFLAEKDHQVTGLDISEIGLENMKKLASAKSVIVNPILADLGHYQFEVEAWDSIVSIWCHLPSKLRFRLYRSIKGSLKSGGLIIIESYTPDQLMFGTGGPSDVDFLVTSKELESSFLDFEILKNDEILRTVHEGIGHNGQSAVVQFIARKK